VDTGSSFSILPFSSSSPATGPPLTGPAGETIPCWGEEPLSLKFGSEVFQWTFLRAAVQFSILGVDFLHGHRLLVDVAANCLVQGATGRHFYMQASPSGPTTAVVTAALVAPAGSSTFVPRERPSGGNVSRATSTHQTGTAVFPQSSSSVAAAVPAAVARLAALPEFKQLLSEFMDVLNPSKRLPVPTHGVEHFVVTTGPPVASPFRRLDGEKPTAAKAKFAQLERDGIIRRSDSPWASPLHMVRKADGSWRPCGDYRRLNLVTVPDAYPLPNIMDFQSKVAGCRFFLVIDLRKGYHQIPMHPADIPKTAITTPFGLWEFLRVTFGMRNAGCTFQRMMHRVLADVDAAFPFVDDCLVGSPTWEQHLLDVRAVLERLQAASLVLNGEKCVFAASEVKFLGHRITSSVVSPLPEKVEAVRRHPRPEMVRQLQGFLGMLNFYRRFVGDAARLLRPLTDASKGSPKPTAALDWSAAVEGAFEAAKEALAAAAELAHPQHGAERQKSL
jgi:hypothetical protein